MAMMMNMILVAVLKYVGDICRLVYFFTTTPQGHDGVDDCNLSANHLAASLFIDGSQS